MSPQSLAASPVAVAPPARQEAASSRDAAPEGDFAALFLAARQAREPAQGAGAEAASPVPAAPRRPQRPAQVPSAGTPAAGAVAVRTEQPVEPPVKSAVSDAEPAAPSDRDEQDPNADQTAALRDALGLTAQTAAATAQGSGSTTQPQPPAETAPALAAALSAAAPAGTATSATSTTSAEATGTTAAAAPAGSQAAMPLQAPPSAGLAEVRQTLQPAKTGAAAAPADLRIAGDDAGPASLSGSAAAAAAARSSWAADRSAPPEPGNQGDASPAIQPAPGRRTGLDATTALAGEPGETQAAHAAHATASGAAEAARPEAPPASRPEAGSFSATPALQANPTPTTAASAPIPWPLSHPQFAESLATQISTWTREGVQQAELHLNPAELGPVQVRIRVEGDQAQVQFAAEAAPTRDALQAAIDQLGQAIEREGLRWGGAEVHSGLGASDRGGQGSAQGAGQGGGQGGRPEGQRADGAPAGSGRASNLGPAAPLAAELPATDRRRGLVDLYA